MNPPAWATACRLLEFTLQHAPEPRQPDKEAVIWFVVGDFDCQGAQLDALICQVYRAGWRQEHR